LRFGGICFFVKKPIVTYRSSRKHFLLLYIA